MIKRTELIEDLSPFSQTAFGCRIQSTAAAYGFDEPFAQIWTQDDKAALCKLDDTVILDASPNADFTEIMDFIRMTGADKLLCSAIAAGHTDFKPVCRGEIMVYHNMVKTEAPAGFEQNPSLRDIHALLCECETDTFVPPEFEPFYLDLSHRIRHDAALSAGIRQGEELISCAICVAKTENKAVVSAVAAKPEYRRKGFGRLALNALISQLPQSEIFIFRAEGENREFYHALGFIPCGIFTELSI